MRNFHVKKTALKHHCPTINVENLWALLGNQAREHYASQKNGKAPVVDLVKHVSFSPIYPPILLPQCCLHIPHYECYVGVYRGTN